MKKIVAFVTLILILIMCMVSCDVFSQVLTSIVNPKHAHNFGEWSITKDATCTEEGVKTRYCDCGEKTK